MTEKSTYVNALSILDSPFDRGYIDLEEQRTLPLPHLYVHGGFEGTETRFSLYFPTASDYTGRFFHHITPVPLSENLAQLATGQDDRISFSVGVGAYFVESNGGGQTATLGSGLDPRIGGYLANAAVAEFSRTIAQRLFGEHRPFGYAFGGSGGAYRTIGGAENTSGIWDGFVPYVPGSPMAIPSVFSVRMHAQRILREKFDSIVDAVDPGGSANPYESLNEEESAALDEVTKMGFPIRSWFDHRNMGTHAFSAVYPHLVKVSPGYFENFWAKSGYLGHDKSSSIHNDRVQLTTKVATYREKPKGKLVPPQAGESAGVDNAFKDPRNEETEIFEFQLENIPPLNYQEGVDFSVLSGPATGLKLTVESVNGDWVTIANGLAKKDLVDLPPGTDVSLDNSTYLAAQTFHRHQVPGEGYSTWDQFKDSSGNPKYPQHELVGPMFSAAAAGSVPKGNFVGKMILVATLLDREAFPWQADWYRRSVRDNLAAETEHSFRLWYVDNALHGDSEKQDYPTRTVSYLGVLQEALLQLSEWVEKGLEPSASSNYKVIDGQVHLPAKVKERLGVQPVVTLTVDGGLVAYVKVGQKVAVELRAESPQVTSQIVSIAWDLTGVGKFEKSEAILPSNKHLASKHVAFGDAGTYFVAALASSQRNADPLTAFGRIDNVARVRVVVT